MSFTNTKANYYGAYQLSDAGNFRAHISIKRERNDHPVWVYRPIRPFAIAIFGPLYIQHFRYIEVTKLCRTVKHLKYDWTINYPLDPDG